MTHLIGIDIDLRRCHAWSTEHGRLLYNASHHELTKLIEDIEDATFLVECGSPTVYNLSSNKLYNKLRWFIYNSFICGMVASCDTRSTVLFSPSSAWKKGWSEDDMMATLKITGDNHDIRQCRAMVRMYMMDQSCWVPTEEILEKL